MPDDLPTVETLTGRCISVTRFVAANPRLRFKRRPTAPWADQVVGAIKLIKRDAALTRLRREHVEIWVSSTNGNFRRHDSPFDFGDGVEPREGKDVRVLTLSGLHIAPEIRFIMVRSQLRDEESDFVNLSSKLVELYNPKGERIPLTWDEGLITRQDLEGLLEKHGGRQTGAFRIAPGYGLPVGYGASVGTSSFRFNTGQSARLRALDGSKTAHDGQVVVAKGKEDYVAGSLHPAYPEVRRYWLSQIDRIVKTGVDGIDIRITNHSAWTVEGDAYGFNEPVVEDFHRRYGVDVLSQPFDRARWLDLQGDFYTAFLRQARALTRKAKVAMQVHVNGLTGFRVPGWNRNNVPANFAWQWRKWIEEDLCDSVALKYIPWEFGSQAGLGTEFGDEVLRVAKAHGKEVFSHVRLPWWFLVRTRGLKELRLRDFDLALTKLRWGWYSRLIDGVILYETASFLHMVPETGETHVSPALVGLLAAARNGDGASETDPIVNYVE